MVEEIPTFESMFRKSKGLDLAEEAPSEEESTPSEEQRSRVYDKLTDEDGNSRLKHKANVPALENYDQDIRAPQGEVHDADKLKMRKSADFREMVARKCFEKTGRIPDVEFMDTYEVKKAADESDFNEMAEGYAEHNANEEDMDERNISFFDEPYAQMKAEGQHRRKESKPLRKEISEAVNLTAPMMRQGPDLGFYAGENAKELVGYNTGDPNGRNMTHHMAYNRELEDGVSSALVNILTKKYGLDAESAQGAAMEFMRGMYDGVAGPYPPERDTGYGGESDEEYAERMQNTRKRLKSDKFKKAALDAESDSPIQDREARRQIGRTAPRLVEGMSSLNDGAPLTDADGQDIGQMAGVSSTSRAYNTDDFTMEDAALKNENALEKALRGYLDSNPNITIEDLEKFIESSKRGFRIGVEKPFL